MLVIGLDHKEREEIFLKTSESDGTLMKGATEWYYSWVGRWHRLVPTVEFQQSLERVALMKAEAMTGAAAERAKKWFSADEMKSGGMVWRTIRGNRVLIKPLPGGGGVVVGGASGKLNHFRIDLSTTKEQYSQVRHEKVGADKAAEKEKLEGMSLADQSKYKQEKRQGVKIKKTAGVISKKRYETTVEQIMAEGKLSPELTATINNDVAAKVKEALTTAGIDLPEGIDPDSVDWGKGGIRFEEIPEPRAGSAFATKADVKEMMNAAATAAMHTHMKDIEREAVEVLARHVSGESLEFGAKITSELLDDQTKAAMSIMKARQKMKRELKAIEKGEGAVYISKVNVSTTLTKAEIDEVPDEAVTKQINDMIETQKNIELYDKMDERKLANQKFVDQGAADSFNGIIADMFGAGTVFDADLVRNIGVEGLARAMAAKVNDMGKRGEVLKALTTFFEKNRVKIVDEALAESTRRRTLKKSVMSSIGAVNDAVAMEDWVNAMRFCQRQTSAESRSLGTAIGSLRAVAHMINALEEPPRSMLSFPVGDDLQGAHERMRRAGLSLKDGDYHVDMVSGKATVSMPATKIEKMIDTSKALAATNQKVNDIKAGRENNGYMPPGMAETFKDAKSGTSTALKLKAAQESCVRLFRETGHFLADQQAGLGKTGIAYASAMEAYHNMGDKKILIVVPANLREQMYKDGAMWLNPEMQKLLHPYSGKGGLAGRTKQYEAEGIHIIGHEQLRTDGEALKAAGFGTIIVDEAHKLTSPEGDAAAQAGASQQYEGLMQLQSTKHKIMMSGTNVKNSVDELYKKINWLDPEHNLGSMENFNKRYENENQGTGIFQSASVEAFRKDISPYVFSQKNPTKVKHNENTQRIAISDTQKAEFRTINETFSADPDKSSAAARRDSAIYKVLNDGGPDNPKIQAGIKLIDEKHAGEKVLWHMQRKSAIKSVKAALEAKYGKGCVSIIVGQGDNTLSEGERQNNEKSKAAFLTDPKVRFMLGTSALSTGHNGLQNVAKTQINLDRPATYAEQEQRNARLYRHGQDDDVSTYYLSSNHPYDVNAEDIVESKKKRGEMMGNPQEVEGLDDDGFMTQLQRTGFFANPDQQAAAAMRDAAEKGAQA